MRYYETETFRFLAGIAIILCFVFLPATLYFGEGYKNLRNELEESGLKRVCGEYKPYDCPDGEVVHRGDISACAYCNESHCAIVWEERNQCLKWVWKTPSAMSAIEQEQQQGGKE